MYTCKLFTISCKLGIDILTIYAYNGIVERRSTKEVPEMLYVADERCKINWRDDAFDSECMNKAYDFITCESRTVVKKEVTFGGDMVLWTTRIGD